MIYFIQSGKTGPIKIGYTKDKGSAQKRLDMMQTGSPEQLNIIGMVEGERKDKFAFHRKFHPYQLHGEWFQPDHILIDFINQVCGLKESATYSYNLDIFEEKSLDEILADIEKNYIKMALIKTKGRKQEAAELLGLSFRTFRYRLSKHGM
jgi:DNA-binding protein Fis